MLIKSPLLSPVQHRMTKKKSGVGSNMDPTLSPTLLGDFCQITFSFSSTKQAFSERGKRMLEELETKQRQQNNTLEL